MFPIYAMTMGVVGAAAPTISSVSPSIGDTAGGGGVVSILGTNFTGASGVTIGGVAATSITVVSSTSITCVPGAHAAATVQSILVTTASGTNAANTLFEYWTPAQITGIDVYLDSNKGVTGGAAVSAWLDQSSNARNFVQATGGSRPAQTASVFGTLPSLRFTPQQWLALGSAITLASGMSCFAVIKQPTTDTRTAVTAVPNAPYTIVASASGYMGFGLANGQVQIQNYDGAAYHLAVRGSGLNDNVAHLVGATFDAVVNRKCYVGATQQGATSTDAAGLSASSQYDSIGGSVVNDGFANHLGAVVIVSGVISGSDLNKLNAWAQQRFAVT